MTVKSSLPCPLNPLRDCGRRSTLSSWEKLGKLSWIWGSPKRRIPDSAKLAGRTQALALAVRGKVTLIKTASQSKVD
eukprot:8293976-Heterocapsa_arctica.AAC.1